MVMLMRDDVKSGVHRVEWVVGGGSRDTVSTFRISVSVPFDLPRDRASILLPVCGSLPLLNLSAPVVSSHKYGERPPFREHAFLNSCFLS
jgi:hypothetical protein